MSKKKISALTELAAAAAATDMVPIVDVSDTTDAATGTTKKITATNIAKGVGIGAGNTTAEPVKIDTSNGRLGVGESSPTVALDIVNSTTNSNQVMIANVSTNSTNKHGGVVVRHYTNSEEPLGLIAGTSGSSSNNVVIGGGYAERNAATTINFYTAASTTTTTGTQRMTLNTSGNLGLGTSTFGTDAARNLAIFNGTAPASSPADQVQLYAEDVSTSELKVRDEAGNIATLSPHNFELLGERSEDMAWSYSAKNVFVGKEIAVDMAKVIRALEKLTGESYIKIKDLKKSEVLDWDEEEKKKETTRKAEIVEAKVNGLPEPGTYSKKSKPAWVK